METNRFIKIPIEIAEALAKINLSPYESRILWTIWRKTYGWQKKKDQISITQFQKFTNLKRRHISRTLAKLENRDLITRKGYTRIKTYEFQMDYMKWKKITKRSDDIGKSICSEQSPKFIVTSNGYKSSLVEVPTKKNNKKINDETYIEFQLASLLLKEIRQNKSDFKEPNLQVWAKEIDLMIRQDNRSPEKIRDVICWCQRHQFWWKNVLSTKNLREKFDRLEAEMEEEKMKGIGKRNQRAKVEYEDLTGGL